MSARRWAHASLSLVTLVLLDCAPPTGSPGATTSTTSSSSSSSSTEPSTSPTTGTSTSTSTTSTSEPAPTTTLAPDLGAPPCTDPERCPPVCDTILQNCPSGQKCTGIKPGLLDAYQGTACVSDNAGRGTEPGSVCFTGTDGWDTCGPDSMCMQYGWGEGTCVPFCTGDVDAPQCDDPGLVCARIDRTWPISLCAPPCDPLAYDCPDAQADTSVLVCQPAAVGFGCVIRGNLSGHELGEPCLDHRDCEAAAYCAAPDDVPGCAGMDGCCAAYCDLTAPSCPVDGQSCVAYYAPNAAPQGLEDVGLCAVP